MSKVNCWTWDGYLGTCVKEHPWQWWQYMNVYSISAVLVVAAVSIAVLLIVANRVARWDS